MNLCSQNTMPTENWYDYPEYYDGFFRSDMVEEAEFIKQVIHRFSPYPPQRRILEPGCGTGRLLISLASYGYQCTGFDINEKALAYLQKKLTKHSIEVNVLVADMKNFYLDTLPFDAAFSAVGTFLHLMSEADAINHLHCVQRHLRQGGIYVLAMHLLPKNGFVADRDCETFVCKGKKMSGIIKTIEVDRKKRLETLSVTLRYAGPKPKKIMSSCVQLRTYTLRQLQNLLSKIPNFSILETYDFSYDINQPVLLSESSEDIILVLQNNE